MFAYSTSTKSIEKLISISSNRISCDFHATKLVLDCLHCWPICSQCTLSLLPPPWKHQKIIFWCFQGVEIRCIGNKSVKLLDKSLKLKRSFNLNETAAQSSKKDTLLKYKGQNHWNLREEDDIFFKQLVTEGWTFAINKLLLRFLSKHFSSNPLMTFPNF